MLENPIVCKDSDHLAVWIYLLLNATHKEYAVIFGGKKIILQAGQLLTGRKSISSKLKINESKVQRVLKTFEIERQIEQQTSTKNRIVSIVNWSSYQESEQQNEQQVNNKRTTSEQQVNTNKNVDTVKNVIMEEDIYRKIKHLAITQSEYEKLLQDGYSKALVDQTLDDIENYKKNTNYINLNLTVRKWIKKSTESNIVPIKSAPLAFQSMKKWLEEGEQ
jgi:DNA-binding transcriptional MocR family regulator